MNEAAGWRGTPSHFASVNVGFGRRESEKNRDKINKIDFILNQRSFTNNSMLAAKRLNNRPSGLSVLRDWALSPGALNR